MVFCLLGSTSEPALYPPRQFVLPLGGYEGVLACHFEVAVTGNFGCFDCATTDLLPRSYVGPTERVWPQTREVDAIAIKKLLRRAPGGVMQFLGGIDQAEPSSPLQCFGIVPDNI